MSIDDPTYRDLLARVDELTGRIALRRAADLECKLGCTMCCQVQLSISPLEAENVQAALLRLDSDLRERLRQRASDVDQAAACVMLEENGACAIYADRPLVCRTQGHALRYPAGMLPDDTVFAVAEGGDITWCPLNYTERVPASEDVLEAELIDELLARITQLASANPLDALRRVELRSLARGP